MDFELDSEHRMLKDLVARFVAEELVPLERTVMAREAATGLLELSAEEHARLNEVSKARGLWGLDAPEARGGSDLPVGAMVGVNEEFGDR